jgi:epoxyqueuosine reductase
VVTPHFGSALRLSSMLTDAPLDVGSPIEVSRCGRCTLCTDAGTAHAIKGENWDVSTDRDILYDASLCRKAAREKSAIIGVDASLCGKCIEVCYTQRYINCT